MRTRLFLNPSNNALSGAYPAEAEHIHIVLDSAVSAFSVRLPDALLPEHKEFIFYNIPSSGAGFDVTIQAVDGQIVLNSGNQHVLAPGDTVTFVADLRVGWLISDINAQMAVNLSTYLHNGVTVPTSPTSSGVKDQVAYDGSYFYVCRAANSWKRVLWDTVWGG